MNEQPVWIAEHAPPGSFPEVRRALREPDGLLAVGADLEPARLLEAYGAGIFPWFSRGQPILWWSPDPRMVLFPEQIKVSRSLRKRLRRDEFEVRYNTVFAQVMRACAQPRQNQDGTWILAAMINAYTRLHQLGFAHSVECWSQGQLVGGLYGVAIGQVFFGESMFSVMRDASKVALWHLCQRGYQLIDCQIYNPHLSSLGAVEISREHFCGLLKMFCRLAAVGQVTVAGMEEL